jgi:hypothetical protein
MLNQIRIRSIRKLIIAALGLLACSSAVNSSALFNGFLSADGISGNGLLEAVDFHIASSRRDQP